jgi:hypothetical protein
MTKKIHSLIVGVGRILVTIANGWNHVRFLQVITADVHIDNTIETSFTGRGKGR